MINRLYIFLTAIIVVFLDQLSKYIVTENIYIGQNIVVFKGILSITKVYNTGAAFSLLQGNTGILIFFSLLVSIILIYYFIKNVNLVPYILVLAWGLILGGTIGNLIDRINLGYVIDFIKLDFINFPIFNLADFAINVGAFLILFHTLIKSYPVRINQNK